MRSVSLAQACTDSEFRTGNRLLHVSTNSLPTCRWPRTNPSRLSFRTTRSGKTTPSRGLSLSASMFDQAWGTSIDLQTLNQTLAPNLFAISIFPYAGFLYHLTLSRKAPPLTLFGFYFLLVFVFVTIPAGIYAKNVYGTTLANVDFLHGPAEFLLTLTNLFIVLGLQRGIKKAEAKKFSEETSAKDEAISSSSAAGYNIDE